MELALASLHIHDVLLTLLSAPSLIAQASEVRLHVMDEISPRLELGDHVAGMRVAPHTATMTAAHSLAAMCHTPMQSVYVHTQNRAYVVSEKNTLVLV